MLRAAISPPPMNALQAHKKEQAPVAESSLFLRIGLPVSFALLAGMLNLSAVRRQITPTIAYEVTADVLPGNRLSMSQIREVEVAGNLNRDVLLTPESLRGGIKASGESRDLKARLEENPQFFSKALSKGELLTKSALGGMESVQPGSGEELVVVHRKIINGAELYPGQVVHFLAKKQGYSRDESEPQEIGPFRVALEPLDSEDNKSKLKSDHVRLIFRLDASGNVPADAKILREASFTDSRYELTVIIKSAIDKRSPKHTAGS